MAAETANPKPEMRNPKQARNTKRQTGTGTERNSRLPRRSALIFLLGVSVGLAGVYGPSLLKRAYRQWRPAIEVEWLKARCFEFQARAAGGVPWESVGQDRWYFARESFGVRWFPQSGQLVFAPDGDGPKAYVLAADGRLFASPDDAVSVACEWAAIKQDDGTDHIKLSDWHPVE